MRHPVLRFSTTALALTTLTALGCGKKSGGAGEDGSAHTAATKGAEPAAESAAGETGDTTPEATPDEAKGGAAGNDVFFGNLHVHTSYSFDAVTLGAAATPDDAYRWAKGEAIDAGKLGGELKIKRPLDWYAVSDHAEYLGVFKQMQDPTTAASKLPIAKEIYSEDTDVAFKAYAGVLNRMDSGEGDADLKDPAIAKTIWAEVVATAEKHNDPGKFTAFPAFEWTGQPDGLNIHRVVLFKTAEGVPELPFGSLDSRDPRDLWSYMDEARSGGAEVLAVPHNGNASDGLMFPTTDADGKPLDAEYAKRRMSNEPLYEISQIKGTSESHPQLSPNDEFAGFELWDYYLDSIKVRAPKNKKGSYARQALLDGLAMEASAGHNPYKFGFIGDSDTHNAAATIEEDNFSGKFGIEADPKARLDGPIPNDDVNNKRVREFSSGGLAAVWAPENTREALFEAMERKETYATSGTRLRLRFFGGWSLEASLLDAEDWVKQAYEKAVPMGQDLPAKTGDGGPSFVVFAEKDPAGANLDRIQIVKGWVEGGEQKEKIFDVALSGDRKPGPDGKVPPVGDTVDPKTAKYTNDIGAAQLSVVWTDPEFAADQHAVYYVRVLEIPTPRWSTHDAAKLGRTPREDLPVSIQERAWSSPIWYAPAK